MQPIPQCELFQQIEAAEHVLTRSDAAIREAGDRAFYRRSTDEIHLPQRTRFTSEVEFYSVALHELTHNADPRIMPRQSSTLPELGAFRRGYSA